MDFDVVLLMGRVQRLEDRAEDLEAEVRELRELVTPLDPGLLPPPTPAESQDSGENR